MYFCSRKKMEKIASNSNSIFVRVKCRVFAKWVTIITTPHITFMAMELAMRYSAWVKRMFHPPPPPPPTTELSVRSWVLSVHKCLRWIYAIDWFIDRSIFSIDWFLPSIDFCHRSIFGFCYRWLLAIDQFTKCAANQCDLRWLRPEGGIHSWAL